MAIKNGETANADEVLNLVGITFKNQAQLLFNSALIGFNSKLNVATGVPNLKNIKYDVFNSDTMTKTNMFYDSANKMYVGPETPVEDEYVVYDDCSNSSIDATKWDIVVNQPNGTASAVETTYLQLEAFLGTSVGGNGPNARATSKTLNFDTYNCISIDMPLYSGTRYNDSKHPGGSITFGGVSIFSGGLEVVSNNKFQILKTANAYYYRRYNSTWGSWTKFSPTTSVLDFYVIVTSTGTDSNGTATLRVNNIRYLTLATLNSYIVSPATTVTATDCIATYNSDTSCNVSVSSDGTNYEAVTDATIKRFTNVGNSLKIKLALNSPGVISEYAILYNVGASE
jgi:hypothetical protein